MFPVFLNITLISSTTFPVFSFQKDPITLSLVYLWAWEVSFNLQVNVPTLKSTCIPSELGHHILPWNAGSVSAWIMLRSTYPGHPSSLWFKLQRKYWFSAWLIDKFLPHCFPLMKAYVTGLLQPQEETLISFKAELSRGSCCTTTSSHVTAPGCWGLYSWSRNPLHLHNQLDQREKRHRGSFQVWVHHTAVCMVRPD